MFWRCRHSVVTSDYVLSSHSYTRFSRGIHFTSILSFARIAFVQKLLFLRYWLLLGSIALIDLVHAGVSSQRSTKSSLSCRLKVVDRWQCSEARTSSAAEKKTTGKEGDRRRDAPCCEIWCGMSRRYLWTAPLLDAAIYDFCTSICYRTDHCVYYTQQTTARRIRHTSNPRTCIRNMGPKIHCLAQMSKDALYT